MSVIRGKILIDTKGGSRRYRNESETVLPLVLEIMQCFSHVFFDVIRYL